MPRALTATVHLYAVMYDWTNEWQLTVFISSNMACISDESTQYVYIKEAKLTAELPDADTLTRNLVVSLRERQDTILAEARLAHTKIEERIQSLLAITHTASES